MLHYHLLHVALSSFSYSSYGSFGSYSEHSSPEFAHLRDALTQKSIAAQLETFKLTNERALQLWLKNSWDEYEPKAQIGQHHVFFEHLQHARAENLFVQQHQIKQGSPNNPYLQNKRKKGYTIEVQPAQIAARLMRCRESLAVDWSEELGVLATGAPHEQHPDDQLLAGLATRAAVREYLHDLKLRPSQLQLYEYVQGHLLLEPGRTGTFGPTGDVERWLDDVAAQPLVIRGSTLVDPMELAEEVRARRGEIETRMAVILEGTSGVHHEMRAAFLEGCLGI